MSITLYSTHCPKCKVIEAKLKQAGLEYTEVNDVNTMLQLGYRTAPILDVDGQILDFSNANKFLKGVIESNGSH